MKKQMFAMAISIHPPRVGRDIDFLANGTRSGYFNPPSPCGEGRLTFPAWRGGL